MPLPHSPYPPWYPPSRRLLPPPDPPQGVTMQRTLSIDREDFELQDALARAGGWGAARRAFGDQGLADLLRHLNEAIAA